MVLLLLPEIATPLSTKFWITKPRTVLPEDPLTSWMPSCTVPPPLSTIAGRLPLAAKLSSVVALMFTTPVIDGSAEARLIVWMLVPEMEKVMLSVPALPFALMIAWRREPAPESLVLVTV